jgi:YidC/Oxa1 family membrane protein insertase
MEKRALTAMVLILLVLIVYQVVFSPQKRPQQAPSAVPADTSRALAAGGGAPGTTARPPGVKNEAVPASDTTGTQIMPLGLAESQGPGKDITVRTPLYAAVFSSRGGVLTSFRLNRYPSATNEPVELVPAGGRLPFALALFTKSGDRLDLSGAAFTVSPESLEIKPGEGESVVFALATPQGLTVKKTFKFQGDAYTMGAQLEISGAGSENIRAVEFGWQSGLQVTEPNRNDDLRNFASITLTDQGLVHNSLAKAHKNLAPSVGGPIKWSGIRTKYFLVSFIPPKGTTVVARAFPGTGESIGMALEAETGTAPLDFTIYAGPLDYQILKSLGNGLDKAVDFGWKWMAPLSKLIFVFMVGCHRVIPNYGWVIIILSALTKLLFHPLTQKSMKSMKEMQKIQPEIAKLRETHKKDSQALNKAIMELYRKRGVNPMGGCLPLVLQMPVFIALFNVLQKTIELRRAKFIFWMNDLSAPDVVAKLPFSLPFVGSVVSLLPILMGVAMFLQQKMTTSDPKQAMMTYLLPIVFTLMFFRFPSGLVLYWLVNNILTIIHQYLMNRADSREPQPVATGG